jgi:hypothetical protein
VRYIEYPFSDISTCFAEVQNKELSFFYQSLASILPRAILHPSMVHILPVLLAYAVRNFDKINLAAATKEPLVG